VRPRASRPGRRAIAQRVEELLRRVQLEGLGKRYPAQLSGGQRQRVALARALAIEPALLLLDEPFGALDAQVRHSLRGWLRDLQRSLKLTTVFVTHDQEEALELADRVVVMNRGRIEQIGTPEQVYRHPATPFVHAFVGRSSRLEARAEGRRLVLAGRSLEGELPPEFDGRALEAWLRPEQVALATRGSAGWSARVLRLRHHAGTVRATLALSVDGEHPFEAEWSAQEVARHGVAEGGTVAVQLRELSLYADTGGGVLRHGFRPLHDGVPAAPAETIDIGPWLHRRDVAVMGTVRRTGPKA